VITRPSDEPKVRISVRSWASSVRAIEERGAAEVLAPLGVTAAASGARAFNPAFDVTPAGLITAIVTERGVIQPVTRERIAEVMGVWQA
jgi:methylthioribose-1-phosphate isomerase